MSGRVANVQTTDTQRDITDLLNRYCSDPETLLGMSFAESGLREHSERRRAGCDTSFGLCHQSVCWLAETIPGVTSAPGTRPPDDQIELIREWYWDAERSLRDAGPRLDRLLQLWDDPLEALCRWNKPSIPGYQNPNRPTYQRGLAAASRYRAQEEPMPPATDNYRVSPEMRQHMADRGDAPLGDEDYYAPKVSICPGSKGLYFYHQQSNLVYVAAPKA